MKKHEVLWLKSAIKDLEEIIEYIRKDDPDIAQEKYWEIKKKAETLSDHSLKGRIIPELATQNIQIFRELIAKPWRIIYRIEDDRVFVYAVIDGRRDFEDILLNILVNR